MEIKPINKTYVIEYPDGNGIFKKIKVDFGSIVIETTEGEGVKTEKLDIILDNELYRTAGRLINELIDEGYILVHDDLTKDYYEFEDEKEAVWRSADAVIHICLTIIQTIPLTGDEEALLRYYIKIADKLGITLNYDGLNIQLRDNDSDLGIVDCLISFNNNSIKVEHLEEGKPYACFEKTVTSGFQESFTAFLKKTDACFEKAIAARSQERLAAFLKKVNNEKWLDRDLAATAKQELQPIIERNYKSLKSAFKKALLSYSAYDDKWINKIIRVYGGTPKDPSPYSKLLNREMLVLFEFIRDIPEKKINYETVHTNLYLILADVSRELSFDRAGELLRAIRKDDVLPDPRKFYFGDKPEGARIAVETTINLNNIDEVRPLVETIADNIDTYLLKWRLRDVYYRLEPPKGVKAFPTEEIGLLDDAVKFEELWPLLEKIAGKIIEYNRIYPLFKEHGNFSGKTWKYYIGDKVIAHFAALNPQKYDALLAEYIANISNTYEPDLSRLFYRIRASWDEIPDLPLTLAAFPEIAAVELR